MKAWETATNVLGVVLLIICILMAVAGMQMIGDGQTTAPISTGATVQLSDSLIVVAVIIVGLLVGLLLRGKASAALLALILIGLWAFALAGG